MKNPIKEFQRRRTTRRIEAYQKIPTLLQQLDDLTKQQIEQAQSSPEDIATGIQTAKEVITSRFPELIPEIEGIAKETNADVGQVYLAVYVMEILPQLRAALEKIKNESLQEIIELCSKGTDRELIRLNELNKEVDK